MFITQHASDRIATRFQPVLAHDVHALLEGVQGEAGTVAYIVGSVPNGPRKPDPEKPGWWRDSNGDILVAVAIDGSVETVFYRRSTQDMSAEFFGARKVVDMRRTPLA